MDNTEYIRQIEDRIIELKQQNTVLQQQIIELQKQNMELQSQLNEVMNSKDSPWLKAHRGNRRGSGERSDAIIVSNSIRGFTTKSLVEMELPYRKANNKDGVNYRQFDRHKIYKAIRVHNEEDVARIKKLYADYPDIFEQISKAQLDKWIHNRFEKYKSISAKRKGK